MITLNSMFLYERCHQNGLSEGPLVAIFGRDRTHTTGPIANPATLKHQIRGTEFLAMCCTLRACDLGPSSVKQRRSMKMRSRNSTSVLVLTLAVLLVLGNSVGAGDLVVCTDPESQADVESGSCACCTEHDSHDESVEFEPTPASPTCSDCLDVPMSVPSLESRIPLLVVSLTSSDGRFNASGSAGDCDTGSSFVGNQSNQDRHTLSPLTTIVLLT